VRVELKRLTLQCSTNKIKGYFVDVSQVQPFPSVGVRELRQDASAILRRIKAGEIIEITEHGKPVAQIGPIQSSIVETWIARNLITPAKAPGTLSSVRPVKSATKVLDNFQFIEPDQTIFAIAENFRSMPFLRSLDALHLATAIMCKPVLSEFITYDKQLAKAAELMGFTVAAPDVAGKLPVPITSPKSIH